jgi:hypothetical protein
MHMTGICYRVFGLLLLGALPAAADTVPVVADTAAMTTATAAAVLPAATTINSLTDLNVCALQYDAVFVHVPGSDTADSTAAVAALQTVRELLQGYGVVTGMLVLPADAAGYAEVAAQVSVPAVVVATKGRGLATVDGAINAERLMQAFLSTLRTGGCGSGGCN